MEDKVDFFDFSEIIIRPLNSHRPKTEIIPRLLFCSETLVYDHEINDIFAYKFHVSSLIA